MPIVIKMLAGFLAINSCILFIGMQASFDIKKTADTVKQAYLKPIQAVDFFRQNQHDFAQIVSSVQEGHHSQNKDITGHILRNIEVFNANLIAIKDHAVLPKEKTYAKSVVTYAQHWQAFVTEYINSGSRYTDAVRRKMDNVNNSLNDLSAYNTAHMLNYHSSAARSIDLLVIDISMMTYAALLFGVAISFICILHVTRPIHRLCTTAENILNGQSDDDIVLARKDEFGRLSQSLSKIQSELTANLHDQDQAAHASKLQIAEENKRILLDRLSDDLTESVSHAMGHVNICLDNISHTAGELSGISIQAKNNSTMSESLIKRLVDNMEHVNSSTGALKHSISNIYEQTNKSDNEASIAASRAQSAKTALSRLTTTAVEVENVVSLIEDIAGKINLLALNATIEASRAGEAGRGFAVVAEEVKALAGKTAKATDGIRAQISNVQHVSYDVAEATESILSSVTQFREITQGITSAIDEQASITQNIGKAVKDVTDMTRQSEIITTEVRLSSDTTRTSSEKLIGFSGNLSSEMRNMRNSIDAISTYIRRA